MEKKISNPSPPPLSSSVKNFGKPSLSLSKKFQILPPKNPVLFLIFLLDFWYTLIGFFNLDSLDIIYIVHSRCHLLQRHLRYCTIHTVTRKLIFFYVVQNVELTKDLKSQSVYALRFFSWRLMSVLKHWTNVLQFATKKINLSQK